MWECVSPKSIHSNSKQLNLLDNFKQTVDNGSRLKLCSIEPVKEKAVWAKEQEKKWKIRSFVVYEDVTMWENKSNGAMLEKLISYTRHV